VAKILKGFKFRLYPTDEQQVLMEKHFGCSRFVYNLGLELKNKTYKETKKSLSDLKMIEKIKELKHSDYPFLKEVNSQSVQDSLWNLSNGFTRFFKKISRFPQFKSKHKSGKSFGVPQHFTVDVVNGNIIIPKFKDPIKCIFHRKVDGKYNSLTISKNKKDQYYVSILVQTEIEKKEKYTIDKSKSIGIDLGLSSFLTTSEGIKVENPRHLRKKEKRLKRIQRRFSKTLKRSKNREKMRLKLSTIHQKISNSRKDFHHKLSNQLVRENQTICIEDLSVKNMMKNRKLSKSIGDVGWSQFIRFLTYKCDWFGVNLLTIGRFEPSSKMCECGKINQNLKLSERTWKCSCGLVHDRDVLAANNILKFAFDQFLGREPSEIKPLESLTSDNLLTWVVKSSSTKEEKYNDVVIYNNYIEAPWSLAKG